MTTVLYILPGRMYPKSRGEPKSYSDGHALTTSRNHVFRPLLPNLTQAIFFFRSHPG